MLRLLASPATRDLLSWFAASLSSGAIKQRSLLANVICCENVKHNPKTQSTCFTSEPFLSSSTVLFRSFRPQHSRKHCCSTSGWSLTQQTSVMQLGGEELRENLPNLRQLEGLMLHQVFSRIIHIAVETNLCDSNLAKGVCCRKTGS